MYTQQFSTKDLLFILLKFPVYYCSFVGPLALFFCENRLCFTFKNKASKLNVIMPSGMPLLGNQWKRQSHHTVSL